ncbi:MAG TPA: hypothetical protein VEC99_05250 [Clostridia bacterium]|nr:hypothetical protein [Clostridia bacterium]
MTTQRKFFWGMTAVVSISAAALCILLLAGEQTQAWHPVFRLERLTEVKQGNTNHIVFRVISVHHDPVLLVDAGRIHVPAASPSPILRCWSGDSKPAIPSTNFVPVTFNDHFDFSIIAPTNDAWGLQVQLLQPERGSVLLKRRVRETWRSVRVGQFSGLRVIWFGPPIGLNYLAMSSCISNTVQTTNLPQTLP